MLMRNRSTLADVVEDFILSLDDKKLDSFKRYIPNRMWIQDIDFYDYIISRYDFNGSGGWIAQLILDSDPLEAMLLQKFSVDGKNTFEWEAGVIINSARERLGVTYEWQKTMYGNPSDNL
ncbi:hypothetical protein [Acinetobacter sp. ANC 4805]|uniref:hypothetical protein n=1 Tax=Acinetobacter sp. ANC 4805 TaxID=2923425 RepID=UPI001F4BAD56|nr:hypothetical protein [Acinetobacter sp. ANC 4805]MCH7310328.1 hypothetical protein [Acinetobacter sp. ANC 4805]